MRLIFLGTGAMIPTKERNLLSVALEYNGNIFLFDTGESVQKQIKFTTLHLGKIKKIFVSHWHGDHVIGLPGLLLTLNNIDSFEKLEIYGPEGTGKYVSNMLNLSLRTAFSRIIRNWQGSSRTSTLQLDSEWVCQTDWERSCFYF